MTHADLTLTNTMLTLELVNSNLRLVRNQLTDDFANQLTEETQRQALHNLMARLLSIEDAVQTTLNSLRLYHNRNNHA